MKLRKKPVAAPPPPPPPPPPEPPEPDAAPGDVLLELRAELAEIKGHTGNQTAEKVVDIIDRLIELMLEGGEYDDDDSDE